MKLTIFGATGGVGRQVVTQALAAGHDVTAVVRDPARLRVDYPADLPVTDAPGRSVADALGGSVADAQGLPVDGAPRLTVAVVPDQTEPESLVAPISGSDAVISGIGPSGARDGRAAAVTHAILGALATAGVSRFVAISAQPLGAVPPGEGLLGRLLLYPLVRLLFRAEYRQLAVLEDDIGRSGAEWTIVRPPRLLDEPEPGPYRTVTSGNVPNGRQVSRAEVARCMLAVLSDPATIRQPVGVAR
jgi:putative NADH-flavin reductase